MWSNKMLQSCFFNGTNYQPIPRALLIGTENTVPIKYMLNTANKITVMLNKGQINIQSKWAVLRRSISRIKDISSGLEFHPHLVRQHTAPAERQVHFPELETDCSVELLFQSRWNLKHLFSTPQLFYSVMYLSTKWRPEVRAVRGKTNAYSRALYNVSLAAILYLSLDQKPSGHYLLYVPRKLFL